MSHVEPSSGKRNQALWFTAPCGPTPVIWTHSTVCYSLPYSQIMAEIKVKEALESKLWKLEKNRSQRVQMSPRLLSNMHFFSIGSEESLMGLFFILFIVFLKIEM